MSVGHTYEMLLGFSNYDEPTDRLLARMVASWVAGECALPAWLGLTEEAFRSTLRSRFGKGFEVVEGLLPDVMPIADDRIDEVNDLKNILLAGRSEKIEAELWLAGIVAAGCMGNDHLWHDLGLSDRSELSGLMADNFGPLSQKNHKDMKWKKFLYKQLCEEEGIYICRAPSCEVCTDYHNCFGPEE